MFCGTIICVGRDVICICGSFDSACTLPVDTSTTWFVYTISTSPAAFFTVMVSLMSLSVMEVSAEIALKFPPSAKDAADAAEVKITDDRFSRKAAEIAGGAGLTALKPEEETKAQLIRAVSGRSKPMLAAPMSLVNG